MISSGGWFRSSRWREAREKKKGQKVRILFKSRRNVDRIRTRPGEKALLRRLNFTNWVHSRADATNVAFDDPKTALFLYQRERWIFFSLRFYLVAKNFSSISIGDVASKTLTRELRNYRASLLSNLVSNLEVDVTTVCCFAWINEGGGGWGIKRFSVALSWKLVWGIVGQFQGQNKCLKYFNLILECYEYQKMKVQSFKGVTFLDFNEKLDWLIFW